jgi:heme-degrading monooxygenase HmoA
MILEVAILNICKGKAGEFEEAFQIAQQIIIKANGYHSHQLQRCVEDDHTYILLVKWEQLEDHIKGFRESEDYKKWKQLLHHYYDPFPTAEHYTLVGKNNINE